MIFLLFFIYVSMSTFTVKVNNDDLLEKVQDASEQMEIKQEQTNLLLNELNNQLDSFYLEADI